MPLVRKTNYVNMNDDESHLHTHWIMVQWCHYLWAIEGQCLINSHSKCSKK